MRKKLKFRRRKTCIICDRPIPEDRMKASVTCSKICARKYQKIVNHLWNILSRRHKEDLGRSYVI